MLNFIIKKLKEKKGLNSIEMVIGSLVVITLFAGMTDFIKIHNKMQSVSSSISYVSKIVANQGCLTNNPESSYINSNGTKYYYIDYIKNKKYVDSNTLYNSINRIMQSDGISSSEWRIYIGGQQLSPTTHTNLYSFGDRIPISIEIDYSWGVLAGILPISESMLSGTLRSSQDVVSTYKKRDAGSDTGFTY